MHNNTCLAAVCLVCGEHRPIPFKIDGTEEDCNQRQAIADYRDEPRVCCRAVMVPKVIERAVECALVSLGGLSESSMAV